MYELIKKGLNEYRKLNKQVWFITLSTSDESIHRNIEKDFLMLWCRIRKVCPDSECFFVVVGSDGDTRPHIHALVVDFFRPKEWLDFQWSRVHRGDSFTRKNLVDFKNSQGLAVYFSTQHGVVENVNCSTGWI